MHVSVPTASVRLMAVCHPLGCHRRWRQRRAPSCWWRGKFYLWQRVAEGHRRLFAAKDGSLLHHGLSTLVLHDSVTKKNIREEMRHGLFGPRLPFGQNVTAEIAIAKPYKACTPLTNAADVRDRIVVVLRGECYFVTKAEHAQNAGAVAVLVVNNIPNQWVIMAPPSGYNISRIQIPVLKVLRRANATIQALPTGSSATLVGDCSAHCPAS